MAARNSLERVLAILELFTEDRPEWTPDAMMQALGYTRPTLYRYLKTLREGGLLTSLPDAGYTLGPKVVEMDYLMRKADSLVLNGREELADLAAAFPCTALLVRWYGNRILCVDSNCSVPDPVSSYPRGRPMPLTRGAISRSILAFLPRRRQLRMIADALEEFRALGLGNTPEDVIEALRPIRRQGFSVAHGEVTPGVVGIAAPIFDSARSPIASLCITVGETRIDADRIASAAQSVRHAADRISRHLGDRRAAGQQAAQ